MCIEAGKTIEDEIYKPVWQFDSKWTCIKKFKQLKDTYIFSKRSIGETITSEHHEHNHLPHSHRYCNIHS